MNRLLASAIWAALIGIACSEPQGVALPQKEQAPRVPPPAQAPAASPAADPVAKPAAPGAGSLLVATYRVPELKGERVKSLVSALADQPGVRSARVEPDGGLFKVTFQPGGACPRAMLQALAAVAPGVTLQGITPASGNALGPKHDCGECPMKKSCRESH
jgi:hypothetical protein